MQNWHRIYAKIVYIYLIKLRLHTLYAIQSVYKPINNANGSKTWYNKNIFNFLKTYDYILKNSNAFLNQENSKPKTTWRSNHRKLIHSHRCFHMDGELSSWKTNLPQNSQAIFGPHFLSSLSSSFFVWTALSIFSLIFPLLTNVENFLPRPDYSTLTPSHVTYHIMRKYNSSLSAKLILTH